MRKLKNFTTAKRGKRKAPLLRKTSRHLPDLEGILSRAIEEYAGCDLFDDSAQSLLYGHLLDTIGRLRGEVIFLRREVRKPPEPCPECAKKTIPIPKQVEKPAIRLQVLHRVFCGSQHHYHDRAIYEDEPSRRTSDNPYGDMELKGDKRVTNIEHYCSQNKEISFILFKEHTCVNHSIPPFSYPSTDRKQFRISSRKERLLIVSEVLHKALKQVARCSPQDTKENGGITQMHAPYLFLYHHRFLLSDLAATIGGETEEHVSLLLAFLNENYKDEYEEADSQFRAGIATKEHIEKLYLPNDIVIDKTGPYDRAYVVKSWLEVHEGDLDLPCWSWEYDGSFLRRAETTLNINAPSDNGSALSTIGIHPISVIKDESLENLRQRGRKFWSMKGQYFASYSGYNMNKTQFHVSTRYHLAFSIH
jgi:hypothetical protein